MADGSLAKKMKLKSGSRAAIINAPEKYIQEFRHDGEISEKLDGKFDWIQIFVKDKSELDKLILPAARALKPDSILWISFPKGSSKNQTDLTRDKGWESVRSLDLKWITLISVDDHW